MTPLPTAPAVHVDRCRLLGACRGAAVGACEDVRVCARCAKALSREGFAVKLDCPPDPVPEATPLKRSKLQALRDWFYL